jgi:hypothetical protein
MILSEDAVARLKPDKLTALYQQRIPEVLSDNLSKLSPEEKKRLCDRIMVLLAKAVHDHEFDPNQYLTEDHF